MIDPSHLVLFFLLISLFFSLFSLYFSLFKLIFLSFSFSFLSLFLTFFLFSLSLSSLLFSLSFSLSFSLFFSLFLSFSLVFSCFLLLSLFSLILNPSFQKRSKYIIRMQLDLTTQIYIVGGTLAGVLLIVGLMVMILALNITR